MLQPSEKLNATLHRDCPAVASLLSARGRAAFFPHDGILGQTAQASGKRYNATIGIALEEDTTPMRLACMAEDIDLEPKDVFPYASSFGKPELRATWQRMIREKNPGLHSPITLPVVTAAITHGLSMAGYLFLDPGDEILLGDKFWGNYTLTFNQQFGANLRTFNTFRGSGLDLHSLHTTLFDGPTGKKVLLLNFPNNPAGYTPTVEEGKAIAAMLRQCAEAGNRIAVLLDDAYFGLVYEKGIMKQSLFADLADLHENVLAVKIDGPTKEDYAWGLRVGFLTYGWKGMTPEASRAMEDKTAGAVRATVSNAANISQSMLLEGYRSPDYARQKEEKFRILQARYREVLRCLDDERYDEVFTPLPFNSGYFMCVELCDGLHAEEVRTLLLKEHDTGVIATGNVIRIAYSSLPTADIAPLFENLYNACIALHPSPCPSPSPCPLLHEPVHA